MNVTLVTREKVSKKSRSTYCLKPLVTNLTLYLHIVSSDLSFLQRTHLHPIVLQPGGKSTSFHVLFESSKAISSFTASLKKIASGDDKVSCNAREISLTL